MMIPNEDQEEYVTIKVKRRVKGMLLEIKGLLMYRDHKNYGMSELIEYLVSQAPTLEIPMSERLSLIEEGSQADQRRRPLSPS